MAIYEWTSVENTFEDGTVVPCVTEVNTLCSMGWEVFEVKRNLSKVFFRTNRNIHQAEDSTHAIYRGDSFEVWNEEMWILRREVKEEETNFGV